MTVSLREQVPLPGRSRVAGNGGAVTAMTAGAARAGAGILAAGGNAADAAVAAMLAAGVVEPSMNGLGGTAYAVVFDPASGRVTALDGSARCPARARENMFEPLEGVGGGLYGFPPTRGDRAETGPLSVLAPTAPVTLVEIHRRFGRLPFAAVVEPAVQLAEAGFVPDWVFCVHVAAGYRRLRLSPAAFALYTRGDGLPFVPAGEEDRLRNPELAGSLRVLAEEGPEPFYRGPIARRLAGHGDRGRRDPLGIGLRGSRRPRGSAARRQLPRPHGGDPAGQLRRPHAGGGARPPGRVSSRRAARRRGGRRGPLPPPRRGVAAARVPGSLRLPGRPGERAGAASGSARSRLSR